MPNYTLRLTGLSDDPNDYTFQCDDFDVGRCYLRPFTVPQEQWSWTIFLGVYVKRGIEGAPLAGYAEELELATQQFRESFDRLIAAGVVALPTSK